MTSAYDPNAFIGYRTRVSRNAVTERSEHYAANECICSNPRCRDDESERFGCVHFLVDAGHSFGLGGRSAGRTR
jgi:hypothetical protein